MYVAIIGGTGVYDISGAKFREEIIETPYGRARVYRGENEFEDLIFLTRHGASHSIPPHRINYRANIKALEQLGVERVMATFAVGSLKAHIPPRGLVAVDQFLDFTHGRESTFFGGGKEAFAHSIMSYPYCPALRQRLLEAAADIGLKVEPEGTYVCTNGPRLETAAEVRMYAQLGGDVVGMTGVPEAPLARELGLHYAAVAYSINWAAGLETAGAMTFVSEGMEELKAKMIRLFIQTLRTAELPPCDCANARLTMHPPEDGTSG